MISLLSLFTAALVSLQYCNAANVLIDSKNELDNNIQPNASPAPKRRLKTFVTISDPPPETVRLIAGSQAELTCEAFGKPTPSIQWLKNGEPLVDYEESANEIMSIHPSSLTRVTSKLVITEASSGDEFTCVANGGVKQRVATTTVFVIDGDDEEMMTLQALFHRPTAPIITLYYNHVFQNRGTNIVLPCRVFSYSESQIYWTDVNDKLIYGNPRMRVLPSGDLLITSLEWDDMGKYTCTAKNVYGKESAETFLYPLKS